jgi:hypothetical protein
MTELSIGAKLLGFFKGLPRWVYIALAVAALIGAGVFFHGRAVKRTFDNGFKAGVLANEKSHADAEAKLASKQAAITAPIRKQNDETNARIAGDADDLRLRGPGKARASCQPSAAAGQPGAAGHELPDAAGSGAAAADGLSDFAAVPWGWLVGRAEQADLDRAEVLAWRTWYARQAELSQKKEQQP